MRKLKLFVFGLGISTLALVSGRSAAAAADPNCEVQCQIQYQKCQEICSQNPCFVSCDTTLQACLDNCASGS